MSSSSSSSINRQIKDGMRLKNVNTNIMYYQWGCFFGICCCWWCLFFSMFYFFYFFFIFISSFTIESCFILLSLYVLFSTCFSFHRFCSSLRADIRVPSENELRFARCIHIIRFAVHSIHLLHVYYTHSDKCMCECVCMQIKSIWIWNFSTNGYQKFSFQVFPFSYINIIKTTNIVRYGKIYTHICNINTCTTEKAA